MGGWVGRWGLSICCFGGDNDTGSRRRFGDTAERVNLTLPSLPPFGCISWIDFIVAFTLDFVHFFFFNFFPTGPSKADITVLARRRGPTTELPRHCGAAEASLPLGEAVEQAVYERPQP